MPRWAFVIVLCPSSCVVNISFKRHLLWNYWPEFIETLTEASLGDGEQTILNRILIFAFVWLPWRPKAKNLKVQYLHNQWSECNFIWSKGSLGDPLGVWSKRNLISEKNLPPGDRVNFESQNFLLYFEALSWHFPNNTSCNPLTFLFLNETLWCDHSFELSWRDDFNDGHAIGYFWEIKKLWHKMIWPLYRYLSGCQIRQLVGFKWP